MAETETKTAAQGAPPRKPLSVATGTESQGKPPRSPRPPRPPAPPQRLPEDEYRHPKYDCYTGIFHRKKIQADRKRADIPVATLMSYSPIDRFMAMPMVSEEDLEISLESVLAGCIVAMKGKSFSHAIQKKSDGVLVYHTLEHKEEVYSVLKSLFDEYSGRTEK